MSTINQQPLQDTESNSKIAKTLINGIDVKTPNESPVYPDLVDLEPFVKVARPTRSSQIYDRIE